VREKLDDMVDRTFAGTTMAATNTMASQIGGPFRPDNHEFLADFHAIYHGKRPMGGVRQSRTGMAHIDFDLHGTETVSHNLIGGLIEEKVRQIAEQQVRQSQKEFQQKLNQQSNKVKDYVDSQLQSRSKADFSRELHHPHQQQHHSSPNRNPTDFISSTDDFKTKAIKKSLVNDTRMALIEEKL